MARPTVRRPKAKKRPVAKPRSKKKAPAKRRPPLVANKGGFAMRLCSFPNPDYGQTAAQSPPKVIRARTLKALVPMVRSYQHEHQLGGGNWRPALVVNDRGVPVAWMSYNGRFWASPAYPSAEIIP